MAPHNFPFGFSVFITCLFFFTSTFARPTPNSEHPQISSESPSDRRLHSRSLYARYYYYTTTQNGLSGAQIAGIAIGVAIIVIGIIIQLIRCAAMSKRREQRQQNGFAHHTAQSSALSDPMQAQIQAYLASQQPPQASQPQMQQAVTAGVEVQPEPVSIDGVVRHGYGRSTTVNEFYAPTRGEIDGADDKGNQVGVSHVSSTPEIIREPRKAHLASYYPRT